MAANTPSTNASGRGAQTQIDKQLMEAAISGDSPSMQAMASQNPSILLRKTPQGNTCLHISSIHGHEGFCKDVLELRESLLTAISSDGETPLIAAVTYGHVSLASFLLGRCCGQLEFKQAVLQQDRYGFTALHHAIRNGYKDLALDLIAAEPALSQAVSKCNKSPLFFALRRDFAEVCKALMQDPLCAYSGRQQHGSNCLHAAVINGDQEMARMVMEKQPGLAREFDDALSTPVARAVLYGKIEILRVILEYDSTLGYEIDSRGNSLLIDAAYRSQVPAARELLKHCPDAPRYNKANGETSLHMAVQYDQEKFVDYVLNSPLLSRLVNVQDNKGRTALHYAVRKCNPRLAAALLSHVDIDATVLDNRGISAAWEPWGVVDDAKTLNWNEVVMLMSRACPKDAPILQNLNVQAEREMTDKSRKNAKSLIKTYTSNTSLVATLIATITFAAAFTLPGGYRSAAKTEGLPIMSKKLAFQAFLIFDVLAMCSSFVVAFICIISRWEDYEFLLYYRSFTKKLMWIAYVATTTAFSTGLYTVLAPHLHWLAITICVLVALLPFITMMLGNWPVLKLRLSLGKKFNSGLLDMV